MEFSTWKLFKISDLFEVDNAGNIPAKQIEPDLGDTPYVTSQAGNNGVQTLISCPKEWLDKGGCILIGGKTFTLTYQKKDFCSNDGHNIKLYPKDSRAQGSNCQLFLIAVIRKSLHPKYTWGDAVTKDRIKEDEIPLPVDSDGIPDWSWIDSYMTEMKVFTSNRMQELFSLFPA